MMDVGNPAYQAKWLSNVLADVQAGGWDGVFMDDTDADMGWHLNGRTIAQVPDAASWRAATRSMLATVGPGAAVGRRSGRAEHLHALGRRLRRAGDVERLAPVHLRRGAGVLLEVGLDELRLVRGQRLDVPAAVPGADRAGRQDLPRASPTRRTPTRARWPGPARTSCSSTTPPTAGR